MNKHKLLLKLNELDRKIDKIYNLIDHTKNKSKRDEYTLTINVLLNEKMKLIDNNEKELLEIVHEI